MTWTFDATIHLSEIAILLTAIWGLFKTGVEMRDSVRGLTDAVRSLTDELGDHEFRIRALEGRPDRRRRP